MRARAVVAALAALAGLASAGTAAAHELRPAFLSLREAPAGIVDVLWRTPARADMRLALTPVLSGDGEQVAPAALRLSGGAAIETWKLRLTRPLRGRSLAIEGLSATMTDVLVRVEFADGTGWSARLTPRSPEATIPARPARASVAATYFALGVEHILLGIDHLAFVLALILIVQGLRTLALTVTAFTAAHSLTLALATLGFIQVPPAPVEAVIALSIVFVAAEAVHARRGEPGLTARAPWLVAFLFGLLHGLGFSSALAEIGLPQGQIPLALLFFNVGVEAGQLGFIGAALGASALLRRPWLRLPRWAGWLPPYAIGSAGVAWLLQRVAGFAA